MWLIDCYGTIQSQKILVNILLSAKSSLKAYLQISWHLVIIEVFVALRVILELV